MALKRPFPEPFTTTVVGSLPRPPRVRALLDRPAPDRAKLDLAVRDAVLAQDAAGIEIVSDGEWRRLSYVGVIADLCSGFSRETREGRSWHTIVEPMRVVRPGLFAEEARFLLGATRRLGKVALPSPYLLAERMWDETRSRAAYPTRRAFAEALVPILRAEIERLRGLPLALVQIDDPHICLFVDDRVRAHYPDPEAELAYAVDLVNRVVSGFPEFRIAIHLCRRNKGRAGWVGEGPYDRILPALAALDVDAYLLEFTIPVAGDVAVLRRLPVDRLIGLGCVDCRGETIDAPEAIAARVDRALDHVDKDRLLLCPDCGFAPGSAADIPLDEAVRKLEAEARAADLLRRRHAR